MFRSIICPRNLTRVKKKCDFFFCFSDFRFEVFYGFVLKL